MLVQVNKVNCCSHNCFNTRPVPWNNRSGTNEALHIISLVFVQCTSSPVYISWGSANKFCHNCALCCQAVTTHWNVGSLHSVSKLSKFSIEILRSGNSDCLYSGGHYVSISLRICKFKNLISVPVINQKINTVITLTILVKICYVLVIKVK